jgi:hypothetical protein
MLNIETVKSWLGIPETTDTFDDALVELDERVGATIERALQWYFGPPRAVDAVLDGTGTAAMFLSQPPVNGVVAVYSRGGVGGTWELMDSETYELRGRGLYVAGTWAKGRLNYRAVYEEGFVEVPGDIQQVALEALSATWKKRGREAFTSETLGDYSYTLADLETSSRAWDHVRRHWRRGRL